MSFATGVCVALLLAIGSILAWRAGGPPEAPRDPTTPVRVLVLGYLVLYGIGSVILAATGEATGGPLLVGAAMVAIGVGTAIVHRLAGPSPPVPSDTTVGPLRAWVVGGFAVIGASAFALLAIEYGLPLLTGDAQAAREGYAGIRLDAFRWLVPPAALALLGIALATRRREAAVIALLALGGVAALEVLAASRALPLELGLASLLLACWAGRRFRLRTWLLIGVGTAALFLGVLFARVAPEGGFSGPLDMLEFALNRSVGRIVLIQPRTIDLVVETFPEEEPYLAGVSYTRWLNRLNGEEPEESLGSWLFERLFPDEPPGGFAAPGVLAEGYANFGPTFALALMVALGMATAVLGRALARAPAEVAVRVLGALLAVVALRTYAASLNGTLVTTVAAISWWVMVDGGAFQRLGTRARRVARTVRQSGA